MHIEHLTKSQIVLLTLLVSFVSSIATGIVTVTLMDQAPPVITQTINRVVEHTVQQIVPVATQSASAASSIQKTVVVKESEAIAEAVAAASPSVVRIAATGDANAAPIAIAVAVSTHTLVSDATALKNGGSYSAILPGGASVPLVMSGSSSGGIILLDIATGTAATTTPAFSPIAISHDQLSLGQTVVALTGLSTPRIASGLVTSVGPVSSATSTVTAVPAGIETNISLDSLTSGSAFINTEGALVGMYTIGTDSVVSALGIPLMRAAASN